MRKNIRSRAFGAVLAMAVIAAACSGPGGDAEPTVNVASFNFPESVILAEIYAQALEENGYAVDRSLNLGSRELIFEDIESGSIGLIPEYLGSSIVVGFGEVAPTNESDAVQTLSQLFGARGVTVLEPAPGQDKNVFVVTRTFSQDNGVTTVTDLAGIADVTVGGPPECENRETCFAGLVGNYGLVNLKFEAIQEPSTRVAALEAGEIQVALLFSTQPVINVKGFVALDGTDDMIAPENIVPVVNTEIIDAYGQSFVDLINSISALITTDVLLDLNGRVELNAESPAAVARAWLSENGFIGG